MTDLQISARSRRHHYGLGARGWAALMRRTQGPLRGSHDHNNQSDPTLKGRIVVEPGRYANSVICAIEPLRGSFSHDELRSSAGAHPLNISGSCRSGAVTSRSARAVVAEPLLPSGRRIRYWC